MTGYGRGESSRKGCKVTVEISSVNRRQGEVAVHLPRDLDALESRVRDEVNRKVSRGRVNVRVTMMSGEGSSGQAVINVELAKSYAREYRKLAKSLSLFGELGLEHLLRAPGVLQVSEQVVDAMDYWSVVQKSLRAGLTQLIAMREKEGGHLKKDLVARVKIMRRGVTHIQKRVPSVIKRYRKQLLGRIENAGIQLTNEDNERLLREVVLFAERSDITEEMTRLQSHFVQFDDTLKKDEPVGRTLDFLTQEMNREINTIGSKANDAEISKLVVNLKAELEKFREQVQNVE